MNTSLGEGRSALSIPPDAEDDVVGKRLARLEKFAEEQNPQLWAKSAPYVFKAGDLVHSKIPRHVGVDFRIETVASVGDKPLFRCSHPNGDVHLFREGEIRLAGTVAP
jgi:hypothetical protein